MRPNVRTNDVTRLCLLTKVNDEYYSQITSAHHFRVCVYMNSNVISLWSNQCMPHSHDILYWNNNKTHPSLVHSLGTINTGPTICYISPNHSKNLVTLIDAAILHCYDIDYNMTLLNNWPTFKAQHCVSFSTFQHVTFHYSLTTNHAVMTFVACTKVRGPSFTAIVVFIV